MAIIIFEADPLIGEDLRDGASDLGVPVALTEGAAATGAALRRAEPQPILVLSKANFERHRAVLSPDIQAAAARVVLIQLDGSLPPGLHPAGLLPDPFTQKDILDVLGTLVGVEP